MKLPDWNHPHKDLLSQSEFNEEDAGKYIAIKSGDIAASSYYRKKITNTLVPDIDTCTYKGGRIEGEFVMRKHEGKRLFSIQMIKQWMRKNSIEVAEEFQPSTPIAIKFSSSSFSRQSSYLTTDTLDRLSRKATLSMEEVVQIIHIRIDEKKWMTKEMLDTWDTINRRLAASGELPKKNQQIKSEDILTIAACLSYSIPCKLVNWLQLPIEGVNWKPKIFGAEEKVGKPEKRIRALRLIISEELKNNVFSKSDPSWPRTKIWKQAVKSYPELFPDDSDDLKDGVFVKAYSKVKKELS